LLFQCRGVPRAHAEDFDATACPPPALDIVGELWEDDLDALCPAQVFAEAFAEAFVPTANEEQAVPIEGQAIRVEITQSVTVAALGQDIEENEDVDLLP
jgi:hypothetical protein